MVKLEFLSQNLIQILNHATSNENLVKYLHYASSDNTSPEYDPLSQPAIADPTSLLFTNLFPQPFDEKAEMDDCSQLRIYYSDGKIDGVVDEAVVIFDIIVAKSLWLCRKNGESSIRPYDIMSEICSHFYKKSVGTVGRLRFIGFRHLAVNKQFDGIRLFAEMTTFTKEK